MNSSLTGTESSQRHGAPSPMANHHEVKLEFQDTTGQAVPPRKMANQARVIAGHHDDGQTLAIIVRPRHKNETTVSCTGCNAEHALPQGCP